MRHALLLLILATIMFSLWFASCCDPGTGYVSVDDRSPGQKLVDKMQYGQPGVTREACLSIKVFMTYEEVVEIFGGTGGEESMVMGDQSVYIWYGKDFKTCHVDFVGKKVMSSPAWL